MRKIIRFIKMPFWNKALIVRRIILHLFRKQYKAFGKYSDIYKPMMIRYKKHISVGKNVFIRNYARIEPIVEWNGIKYNPNIIIGDNVSIEQNLHLTCANEVVIGSNSAINANVMITDIEHEYKDECRVLSQGLEVTKTIIGEYAFIGKNACIMRGVTIGNHCVIGANAVVTHDIPDYAVAAGIPAKVIKINRMGKINEDISNGC